MAGKLGKYQMLGFQSWKGLTSDNHLGALFHSAPQRASDLMVQLLAANRGKSLDTFLSQFPTKMFDDDNEYFWDVIGSARKNIPLVEARNASGTIAGASEEDTGNFGVGTEPFEVVFAEDWFADGEVIVGSLNELYPMRILGDPKMEGTNAVYKVELMGGNTTGIPQSLLLSGERFSVEYAPVEKELSRKVGDVRFTSPVSMRNEFTTLRIQHKVAGNKLGKKLAIGIPMVKDDATGKQVRDTTPMWMHYVDWEVECQWSEYKNNAMAFGRGNRNSNGEYLNFGKSGNVIRMGAGIFEQSEVANTMYYNDTHSVMRLILDSLYELSEGKLEFGNRKFLIKTGERGALLFNREAKHTASGWLPAWSLASDKNPAAVSRNSAAFAPNNSVKVNDWQVTEWIAPNGVEVKLDVDPFYDDKVRNKVLHPEGGVAFSYRFDIWYIGSMDQPNIQKTGIKNQPELRGYQWGLRNPFTGQLNNFNMSYDEDSAVIHKQATFGTLVLDPTRTAHIIPSILRG